MAAQVFSSADVPTEASSPAPDRVISGSPQGVALNGYTSPDERRFAGEWRCSAGAWHVQYAEWEYSHILEGEVRLTGDDGIVRLAQAGQSLVIEPGFAGIWENLTPVRKLYVIDLGAEAGAASA